MALRQRQAILGFCGRGVCELRGTFNFGHQYLVHVHHAREQTLTPVNTLLAVFYRNRFVTKKVQGRLLLNEPRGV
jgi:hypothetical protein